LETISGGGGKDEGNTPEGGWALETDGGSAGDGGEEVIPMEDREITFSTLLRGYKMTSQSKNSNILVSDKTARINGHGQQALQGNVINDPFAVQGSDELTCGNVGHGCTTDHSCCGDFQCVTKWVPYPKYVCADECLGNGHSICKTDRDCCDDLQCGSTFSCYEGCSEKDGWCMADSGCCGDLQCSFGTCKDKCAESGEFCKTDQDCCESDEDGNELECLGPLHSPWEWKCGKAPDRVSKGTMGTCKEGSPPGVMKVMTYNLFLLDCPGPGDASRDILEDLACQSEAQYRPRMVELKEWIKNQEVDVVVVQEMFNLIDFVVEGMAEAGFCHHVVSKWESELGGALMGDGLGIFSKYPIEKGDFLDWFDLMKFTKGAECTFSDKGVMYAKVIKDGTKYHVFDTHTKSNSEGEEHETRMQQYDAIRDFAKGFTENASNEMVLFGGDFNEDKEGYVQSGTNPEGAVNDAVKAANEKRYEEMLGALNAVDPKLVGDHLYSYDTFDNPLPASFWDPVKYRQRLDYIFYSKTGLNPQASSCRILQATSKEGCNTIDCMISDHFPVTCTFDTRSCPSGWSQKNRDDNSITCIAGWSTICGQSCWHTKCFFNGGTWINLDFSKNPYTCKFDL
jgi:endonuclease/exonuclease/phosphatase family metal-dependent hydrolase